MKLGSTRARLMLWSTGVLLLALLVFSFEVYSFLRKDLLADIDRRLYSKANGVKTVLVLERVSGGPPLQLELSEFAKEIPEGNLLQLSTESGELLWPEKPAFANPAAYQLGLQTEGSRRVLLMPFEYQGRRYRVLAGASLDYLNGLMARLRAIMWWMGVPMLVVAACGGYWLSRRALAPVDAMTRAAQSIGVESLSRRLPVPRTGDEIERLARAWNQVLERLEASVKRIRQFTADASHELRTPTALIRATAELALRRERGAADYRKALAEIEGEAGRMTELIESMLALARADASGSRMALAPVDVNLLAADVVSGSEILAQGKGVRIEARAGHEHVIAEANEAGLRRLLRILLDNALEHTGVGGRVTVSIATRNGSVDLAVSDTGEGISPEALPHIFERFYRADQARAGKGAGLGLSIAQVIAQAHGTQIEVESKPGEGSCFRVALRGAQR
ncbi:MAG TPA: ATP-binding protein [Bryobacteraceae bacterium]|jgi:heavy metal sensor kinase